jgi:hypothetical protein
MDDINNIMNSIAPVSHGAPHPQQNTQPPPPSAHSRFQRATAAPAPQDKEYTWGETAQGAAKNFLPSLGSMAGSMVQAAIHPVETVGALGHLAQGAGSQLAGTLGAQQDPAQKAHDEALINALEDHYKQAYGSLKGFKKYLHDDPANVLSDVASVGSLGAGAVGAGAKALSAGAGAAGLAGTAGVLDKAANVASTASRIAALADPANAGVQIAKGIVGVGSKGVGLLTAGAAATANGKRVASILDAAKAGATNDPVLRDAFKSHMTGAAPVTELPDAMDEALDTLKQQRSANIQSELATMNAKGIPIEWGKVDEAIAKERGTVNYTNKATQETIPTNKAANSALNQIQEALEKFRGDNSLESFDAFKQTIDDIRREHGGDPNAVRVATSVYNSALDAIKTAHPEYATTMAAYGNASTLINQISKAFKMGGRNATAENQLKALLATTTGSQKESLIQQLSKIDPRIPYMLAGQELRPFTAHGIRSALLTSPASFAVPHAAIAGGIASSPRLAGSVAYNIGRAKRLGQYLPRPPSGQMLRAAGHSLEEESPVPAEQPNNAPPAEGLVDKDGIPIIDGAPLSPSAPQASNSDFDQIIHQESRGHQLSKDGQPLTSSKGATGIAQVMPATGPEAARLAGLPWDPERFRTDEAYNRALGEAYYNKQTGDFGDPALGAAAYNAGPARVRHALEQARLTGSHWLDHVPRETQEYVKNFLTERNGHKAGGRVGRASGGKIDDKRRHEYLVNRLLKMANDAKKASDKTTEPLLKVADKHIVKALDVASEAI